MFFSALAPTSQFEVYENNIASVKKYSDRYYELILQGTHRKAGFEPRRDKGKKNTADSDSKFDSSFSRTYRSVRELALCNPWEQFATFTLSPEKYDRTDLSKFKNDFTKWLKNLNYKRSLNIRYLLIPEQHKDGAWHMHGLFSGIPSDMLVPFSYSDNVPFDLVKKGYLNFSMYQKKFGFCSLAPIRCLEATANYITKYITKDLASSDVGLNKHLYFASHGLKRAETVHSGYIYQSFEPDFSNEYIAKKRFSSLDDVLSYFSSADDEAFPVTLEDVSPEAHNRWVMYEEYMRLSDMDKAVDYAISIA